jgi:hypothetical protein
MEVWYTSVIIAVENSTAWLQALTIFSKPNQAEKELYYDSGIPPRPEAANLKSVIDTGQHRSGGAPSPASSWSGRYDSTGFREQGKERSHERSERRERGEPGRVGTPYVDNQVHRVTRRVLLQEVFQCCIPKCLASFNF